VASPGNAGSAGGCTEAEVAREAARSIGGPSSGDHNRVADGLTLSSAAPERQGAAEPGDKESNLEQSDPEHAFHCAENRSQDALEAARVAAAAVVEVEQAGADTEGLQPAAVTAGAEPVQASSPRPPIPKRQRGKRRSKQTAALLPWIPEAAVTSNEGISNLAIQTFGGDFSFAREIPDHSGWTTINWNCGRTHLIVAGNTNVHCLLEHDVLRDIEFCHMSLHSAQGFRVQVIPHQWMLAGEQKL
jgi:hypothetical protein